LLPQFGSDYFDHDILSEIYLIFVDTLRFGHAPRPETTIQVPIRRFAPQRELAKSAIGRNLDKFVFRFYRNL
jgi:hypothetical protein